MVVLKNCEIVLKLLASNRMFTSLLLIFSVSILRNDAMSSHWAQSWFIPQITLAVYSEIVVSIYYFIVSLSVLCMLVIICDLIRSEIKNRCSVVVICLENQPRWRRLQMINRLSIKIINMSLSKSLNTVLHFSNKTISCLIFVKSGFIQETCLTH